MATPTLTATRPPVRAQNETLPLLAKPWHVRSIELSRTVAGQLSGHMQLCWPTYLRNLAGISAASATIFAVWVLVIRTLG